MMKMKQPIGRSMMEMLGVLTIIGVLSIAGLVASRQAMDSFKTAQTMDWIQLIQLTNTETCALI